MHDQRSTLNIAFGYYFKSLTLGQLQNVRFHVLKFKPKRPIFLRAIRVQSSQGFQSRGKTMTAIDVMHKMAAAYNAKDVDAMMDLITDNCVMQKDR